MTKSTKLFKQKIGYYTNVSIPLSDIKFSKKN